MESPNLELPRPLAQARRLVLVRYADIQDVRAGRTAEAAARVLRRVRLWRFGLVVAVSAMLVSNLRDLGQRPWQGLVAVVFWVLLFAWALAHLGRIARGLEQLTEAGARD